MFPHAFFSPVPGCLLQRHLISWNPELIRVHFCREESSRGSLEQGMSVHLDVHEGELSISPPLRLPISHPISRHTRASNSKSYPLVLGMTASPIDSLLWDLDFTWAGSARLHATCLFVHHLPKPYRHLLIPALFVLTDECLLKNSFPVIVGACERKRK